MRYLFSSLISIGLAVVAGCGGAGGGGVSNVGSTGGSIGSIGGTSSGSDVEAVSQEKAAAPQVYTYTADGGGLYEISVLGDLGEENWAVAVNDAGQVAGNYQETNGSVSTFFWESGQMVPLAAAAQVSDLNEAGLVVGWLEEANSAAFLYDDGFLQLVPGASFSRAYAINNEGSIVGHRRGEGDEAFLEEDGRLYRIAESVTGYAARINDAGQVIVQELRNGGVGALLLENGSLTDLGNLGGRDLYVRDLNEAGQAVGWGTTANGEYHAFLWQDGRLTDLAAAVGQPFCAAAAIDENGTVLIKAMTLEGYRTYVWRDGEVTDLGTFGASAAMVTDMNNRGQIVGWLETEDGTTRAFLATPQRS